MKITICTGPNYPVPPITGGGMARCWYQLAREFSRCGHSTTIIARRHPDQPTTEIIDGVSIRRIGGFNQHPSIFQNLLSDFVDATRVSYHLPAADILVINDFWLPALAPVLNKAAGKVVVSVNRMPKRQFFLYPQCAGFVCPTPAVATMLSEQSPGLLNKISVIANPFDETSFHPGAEERSGLLYVGRIHPEKGLHLLIDAFKILNHSQPEVRLTVVGSANPEHGGGGQDYLQQLRERSSKLPIAWMGPTFDPIALAEFYQSHLIFCYPSLAENGETFGIAPVEAMASGCVPVLSELPVFGSYLKSEENGLTFNHRSTDAIQLLARSLDELLSARDRLDTMSKQSVVTAQQFTTKCISQQYLDYFNTLLKHES